LVRPRAAGGCGPGSTPQQVSACPSGYQRNSRLAAASPSRTPSVAAASPRHTPSVAAASPRRTPSVAAASPRRSPSVDSGRPSSRDGRNAGQVMSARGAAGNYRSGDLCEFWSNSHNDWLPAQVIKADATGRVIIDLKPNTWISKDEQTAKMRPRRAAQRQMSANRLQQVGGSPQLPRPPLQRTPSWGSLDNRAPSPSGRAMTPMGVRAPSPSGRAMTPMGVRAASPSGRMATPSGRQSPSGRAMTPSGRPDWQSPAGRAASPSGRMGTPSGRQMTPGRCFSSRDSPGRAASPHAGYRPPPPRAAASPLRVGGAAIAGRW
jgi:hypothetical protein